MSNLQSISRRPNSRFKAYERITQMEYRFGPDKSNFDGSDSEWRRLKTQNACWDSSSTLPYVVVICPHCGSKNTHTISDDTIGHHRNCDMMMGDGVYDCPGYVISSPDAKWEHKLIFFHELASTRSPRSGQPRTCSPLYVLSCVYTISCYVR